jgi:hypothetical protein
MSRRFGSGSRGLFLAVAVFAVFGVFGCHASPDVPKVGVDVGVTQAALEFPSQVNYALGKPAQQSSELGPGWGAALAVDGNTDGDANHGPIAHTGTDRNPWWQVDLEQSRVIGQVVLWNRTDCCSNRLHKVYVLVSEAPFASNDLDLTRKQSGVHSYYFPGADQPDTSTARRMVVPVGVSGRYVRVQQSDTVNLPAGEYLQLAEVEVNPVAEPYVPNVAAAELTSQGTPIARFTADGDGSVGLSVIQDGIMPTPGSADPQQQYVSIAGSGASEEWVGYSFPTTQYFATVLYQAGIVSDGGGWFKTIRVQVRQNGAWQQAQNVRILPGFPYQNSGSNYQTFQLDFTPIGGDGIRIIGKPGGTDSFVSVGELRVYAGNPCATRSDGEACDDGDFCTTSDKCMNHQCVSGAPLDCGPPDQCHTQTTCDRGTGACSTAAVLSDLGCDDGNSCTVGDQCRAGTCMPGDVQGAMAPARRRTSR